MDYLKGLLSFGEPNGLLSRAQGLLRQPYASEAAFFKANPHVGGMAAEDNRIAMNPYSSLGPLERQAVMLNEFYRIQQRNPMLAPSNFSITPEQQQRFGGYGSPEDIRATILSRILTGDPSAGQIPAHQQMAADWLNSQVK